MLQVKSACSLESEDFAFHSAETMALLCEGLSSTTMKVNMADPDFNFFMDEQTKEMVAKALTTNLVELKAPASRLYESLGRNMGLPSCKLQVLTMNRYGQGGDELVLLLKDAHKWTLRELNFVQAKWTPAFDVAISAYLAETKHLLKLSFSEVLSPSGQPIASEALLKALDRPDQPLEMLHFGSMTALDSEWLKQCQFIIKLNRQRRQQGPHLLEIATAEQFIAAWQEVGHDCMVVFLLHDEFNLKTKFGELMSARTKRG
jgi:hypothetical protein